MMIACSGSIESVKPLYFAHAFSLVLPQLLLPRDAMLAIQRDISRGSVSVRLRPSFVTRHCIKTAKHRITLATPHDSQGILALMPNISAKFERVTPNGGAKMHVG